jgi:hypothetical protein
VVFRPEDKAVLNEHSKFNKFDKYKAKQETKPVFKVSNLYGEEKKSSTLDLETAKTISGNPSLTREELKSLKDITKDKQEIESKI